MFSKVFTRHPDDLSVITGEAWVDIAYSRLNDTYILGPLEDVLVIMCVSDQLSSYQAALADRSPRPYRQLEFLSQVPSE